jgi:hypothetical protein
MFDKILIANRGGRAKGAVALATNCMARAARAGEFPAETNHV